MTKRNLILFASAISCLAASAAGASPYFGVQVQPGGGCYTSDATLVQAIRGMQNDSFAIFGYDANGVCQYIGVGEDSARDGKR